MENAYSRIAYGNSNERPHGVMGPLISKETTQRYLRCRGNVRNFDHGDGRDETLKVLWRYRLYE
jgi:hypothetical protein